MFRGIYSGEDAQGRVFVHTSCRKRARITAGFARLRGSVSAH